MLLLMLLILILLLILLLLLPLLLCPPAVLVGLAPADLLPTMASARPRITRVSPADGGTPRITGVSLADGTPGPVSGSYYKEGVVIVHSAKTLERARERARKEKRDGHRVSLYTYRLLSVHHCDRIPPVGFDTMMQGP